MAWRPATVSTIACVMRRSSPSCTISTSAKDAPYIACTPASSSIFTITLPAPSGLNELRLNGLPGGR
ncbi:hypothetical protein FQZ97_1137150 [compost metagenome]